MDDLRIRHAPQAENCWRLDFAPAVLRYEDEDARAVDGEDAACAVDTDARRDMVRDTERAGVVEADALGVVVERRQEQVGGPYMQLVSAKRKTLGPKQRGKHRNG